jgi:hypothetical protein
MMMSSQLEEPRKQYANWWELGGEIVQLIPDGARFLNGREKIKGYDVFSAMTY